VKQSGDGLMIILFEMFLLLLLGLGSSAILFLDFEIKIIILPSRPLEH